MADEFHEGLLAISIPGYSGNGVGERSDKSDDNGVHILSRKHFLAHPELDDGRVSGEVQVAPAVSPRDEVARAINSEVKAGSGEVGRVEPAAFATGVPAHRLTVKAEYARA